MPTIIFIVALIPLLIGLTCAYSSDPEEPNSPLAAISAVTLIAGILGIVLASELRGYQRGQIDAANGDMRYELVTHDDGTVTWEESDAAD